MRWLLDTNVLIDAFAGQPAAAKAVGEARSSGVDWVGFSAISRLEVLGFWKLSSEDEQGLRDLLAQFNEVSITAAIIEEAVRVRKTARMKTPDAIVAASALICRAHLITRNLNDFLPIQVLTVMAPATL